MTLEDGLRWVAEHLFGWVTPDMIQVIVGIEIVAFVVTTLMVLVGSVMKR